MKERSDSGVILGCPTCGQRYEVPASSRDDFVAAACDGGKRHRVAVMRVVDDVVEVEA